MPTCENCGAFVTRDFARVFGDNHENVGACVECTTGRDLKSGAAIQ
jgi:hypothetical protein